LIQAEHGRNLSQTGENAVSVAEMRPTATPDSSGGIPSAETLVTRARALAPKLRERAVRAERDRNIPQESVDEFIDAGLIHTLQPKRWGGYEYDHEVVFDVAVELGRSTCGSSAWCLNYLADHACMRRSFLKRRSTMSGAATRRPASPPRLRRPEKWAWRPAVIASTAAGRGAQAYAIHTGL
jgi:alkylation response protein AidB-like acyl-CoA dehydrogenase